MKKPEMLRSIELSKRYCADLDEGVVENSWRKIKEIVRLIAKNRLCLVGTELKDGMIIEDLARSTADEICLVWFSLADKANKKPFMVDLEQLSVLDGGRLIRWPIKAAVSVSAYRPAFVSLMKVLRAENR